MGAMWPPDSVKKCRTPSCLRMRATRCPPCFGWPITTLRTSLVRVVNPRRRSVRKTAPAILVWVSRYPWSMRWPRRRGGDPTVPTRQARRAPADASPDADWRSYDLIAPEYARIDAPQTASIAADLLAITDIPSGGRVLDVGTGTGVAAREAAQA